MNRSQVLKSTLDRSVGASLVAFALLLGGCASEPQPIPAPAGTLRPVDAAAAPATPPEEGRSVLAERYAQREAELKQWKTTASQLRTTLEATRDASEKMRLELAESRRDVERLNADREQGALREAALEKERRELLEKLATQQLSSVRREREALESELRRLESEPGNETAESRAPNPEHP